MGPRRLTSGLARPPVGNMDLNQPELRCSSREHDTMIRGNQWLAETVLIKCLQGLWARFDPLLKAASEASLN